jgi:dihydrofolate reductase
MRKATGKQKKTGKAERKIIAELAVSADGFIARPDGDVEWLNRRARLDYGMKEFYRTIDTILMGRKTYDWAIAYWAKGGRTSGIFDTSVKHFVFSRKPPEKAVDEVEFVCEPVQEFARKMRAKRGENIWMMGGGELIASFLDAGEIDEIQMKVIPIFIGEGIPLIAPRHRDIELKLLASKKYADGVVGLRYEVGRKERG